MDNFKKLIKEALTPDFLKESVNEVIEWRGKPIEMGDKFTDDDGDTFTVIEVSDDKITLLDDDGIKTTFPDDFGSHPDIRARAKFGDWFDIKESVNEEEGWHRQKKYTMDEVKREIDITIHQGEALLKYQMGIYGEVGEYEAWESLKEDLIELHQQSLAGNVEGFINFVDGNDGNGGPGGSAIIFF